MSRFVDLMAIDPGKQTGVVLLHGPFDQISVTKADTIPNTWAELSKLWTSFPVYTVILESFTSTALSYGDQLNTVKLIGAIEFLCWRDNVELVKQTPGVKEGYIREARSLLKKYRKSCTVHTYDALAHALRYLEIAGAKCIGVPTSVTKVGLYED